MGNFAKLYDTEVGQILVKLDRGGADPEVRTYFNSPKFGICEIASNWDNKSIHKKQQDAQDMFDAMTIEVALEMVQALLSDLNKL